jgi:transcriptional regulator with PAS, ATPase and Fis domain
MDHDWPGNVRELENTIGRSIIYMNINERVINTIHLPMLHAVKIQNNDNCIVTANEDVTTLDNVLSKAESEYIENIYFKSNKNKTHTAKVLGISLRSLYYKMEKYNIS